MFQGGFKLYRLVKVLAIKLGYNYMFRETKTIVIQIILPNIVMHIFIWMSNRLAQMAERYKRLIEDSWKSIFKISHLKKTVVRSSLLAQ